MGKLFPSSLVFLAGQIIQMRYKRLTGENQFLIHAQGNSCEHEILKTVR